MAERRLVRSYVVIDKPDRTLVHWYRSGDQSLVSHVREFLKKNGIEATDILPPLRWEPVIEGLDPEKVPTDTLEIAFQHYYDKNTQSLTKLHINSDLAIAPLDSWCPIESPDAGYLTSKQALELINAGALGPGDGRNVNVVVIDQGLDMDALGGNYRGGWKQGTILPGTTKGGHGMMVARNVLAVAPKANIFDCPLIPESIADLPTFLVGAQGAFTRILATIVILKLLLPSSFGGPWILVNSWAVYDGRDDLSPPNDYVNNSGHDFNKIMDVVDGLLHDVVFAAGNCGQICPKDRCGPDNRGPGVSILGANSHSKVLTVGAVRADGIWIGYSSQGPGQSNLALEKPDLCAPSQFSEVNDAAIVNTGTSTAAALAAGTIAGLRSLAAYAPLTVPPDKLRDELRRRASNNGTWESNLGYGVLKAV